MVPLLQPLGFSEVLLRHGLPGTPQTYTTNVTNRRSGNLLSKAPLRLWVLCLEDGVKLIFSPHQRLSPQATWSGRSRSTSPLSWQRMEITHLNYCYRRSSPCTPMHSSRRYLYCFHSTTSWVLGQVAPIQAICSLKATANA